jgi:apolipoprotein N-acyltransferase
MLRQVKLQANRFKPRVLKELLLCFLSAVLLILSFPNFNLEFLAWFGFVPLFLALNKKSQKQTFLLFFITGILFWSGIVYWLVHVTLAGTIVLVLYLALYFGAFGLVIRPMTRRSTPYTLIFIPSAWVLFEYLRSHLLTGFPWALLGYSQYLNLPFIQIADVTGVWGVSFLVMMVNVAIVEIIWSVTERLRSRLKIVVILLISFLFLTLSYGYLRLSRLSQINALDPLRISVIQGNIPQHLKWEESSRDFIIDRYLALSSEALKDRPDLIIWPEAALPVVLEDEPSYYERVKEFIKKTKAPLLFGAVSLRNTLYYNDAMLVSQNGELLARYDKLHLVPFGEYIPLRKVLSFLETVVPIGDFSCGKEYTLFKVPSQFAVLICFEDLFPNLSREFVKKGAGFLVNITNDAWFKKTSSPYQHLSASVFRAVENRVFLVRCANTGVSGFIAPTGGIISLVHDKSGNNIFVPGYKTGKIFASKQFSSFYTRYGDSFIIVCFLFMLCGIIFYKVRR